MASIPRWVWLLAAAILAVLLLRRRGVSPVAGGGPIGAGYNGSPDKTAQNPKVVPYRG